MSTILVVDDERALRYFLKRLLEREGYEVVTAASGEQALGELQARAFDLALVDLKMEGLDGLEVTSAIKKRSPETAVIVLTAFGSLESAVQALRQGAHDYITKPFDSKEVIASVKEGLDKKERQARQRRLLAWAEQGLRELEARRAFALEQETGHLPSKRYLTVGAVTVDLQQHIALVREERVHLTHMEFGLLICLMSNHDQVLSCQRLVREVMGYECSEREARGLVRSHIFHLRRKIEAHPSSPQYIINLRGVGYMFSSGQ